MRTEEPQSKIQAVLRELYHELKASTDDGSIDPDTLDDFYDNVIEPLYKKTGPGTRGTLPSRDSYSNLKMNSRFVLKISGQRKG